MTLVLLSCLVLAFPVLSCIVLYHITYQSHTYIPSQTWYPNSPTNSGCAVLSCVMLLCFVLCELCHHVLYLHFNIYNFFLLYQLSYLVLSHHVSLTYLTPIIQIASQTQHPNCAILSCVKCCLILYQVITRFCVVLNCVIYCIWIVICNYLVLCHLISSCPKLCCLISSHLILYHLPISHLSPEYPPRHEHLNSPTKSKQVPPFRQGLLAHSSISERKLNHNNQVFISHGLKSAAHQQNSIWCDWS